MILKWWFMEIEGVDVLMDFCFQCLSQIWFYLLVVVGVVVMVNVYYIYLIIVYVVDDFGISDVMIGMVFVFN